MRTVALLLLGSLPISTSLLAQPQTALPAQRSIAPGTQPVSRGMMYHRVYVISPLMGSGKPGDGKRPIFAPTPPTPGATTASASLPTAPPSPHSGLLGYQMQLSDDGKTALVEMVFSDPVSFQAVMSQEANARGLTVSATPAGNPAATSAALTNTLQNAVPGLQIFERGKATDAQILSAFQKYKTNFSFAGTSVRPQ
jgi:hypothetical protein